MARSRLLKPDFFEDEKLTAMPLGARLLFQAYWCQADREGRLEDRPSRVAAFAYPPMGNEKLQAQARRSVIAWRNLMVDAGMLRRYEVDGEPYLVLVNWEKHQKIHPNEPKSTLPPPLVTIGNQPPTLVANVAGSGSGSGSGSGKEADTETREPVFVLTPPWPEEESDHPFTKRYVTEHQQRNAGNPPSSVEQAEARRLERDFGGAACIEIATDYDWQKHPNYYRKALNDPNRKRPDTNGTNARQPRAATRTNPERPSEAARRLGIGAGR